MSTPTVLFFMWITAAAAYATDIVQNPNFEIPPHNSTSNSTSQSTLLTNSTSIPGWSWNGNVSYVSIPVNGHAIQLRENGKINQTLPLNTNGQVFDYVMSFTLMAESEICADNHTSVNVTLLDRGMDSERSTVFALTRNASGNLWEGHALFLGRWGGGNLIDLEFASVETNSEGNLQCWPLVDALAVRRSGPPMYYNGNVFANEDFEIGPPFTNSSGGIILQEDDDQQDDINDRVLYSPLQDWAILGTLRYINSDHYIIPHGKAAIELLPIAGSPSGLSVSRVLNPKLSYDLNFTVGDAGDSCIGDLIVFVGIGRDVYNFTMRSNGTGASVKKSLGVRVESTDEPSPLDGTSITFYSYNETRTSNGVLCGPVLDSIFLIGSLGERLRRGLGVLALGWVIALIILVDSGMCNVHYFTSLQ